MTIKAQNFRQRKLTYIIVCKRAKGEYLSNGSMSQVNIGLSMLVHFDVGQQADSIAIAEMRFPNRPCVKKLWQAVRKSNLTLIASS
ncbi:MAG: hypothetical protein WBC73_22890 [Phormidesmis sp.]